MSSTDSLNTSYNDMNDMSIKMFNICVGYKHANSTDDDGLTYTAPVRFVADKTSRNLPVSLLRLPGKTQRR
jgi:hypothetical protein